MLLAVPAGLQCIQFIALAASKPGEYGRFAIFLDVTLLLTAITALARLARHRPQLAVIFGVALIGSIGIFGGRYLVGFVRDCRPLTSRLMAAEHIRSELKAGARTIALWAEPAPYSLPPVDLFQYQLLLLPPDTQIHLADSPADLTVPRTDAPVFPIDLPEAQIAASTFPPRFFPAPAISWADRSSCILLGVRSGPRLPQPAE